MFRTHTIQQQFSYLLLLHLSKIFTFVPIETPFLHSYLSTHMYKLHNFNNKYNWNSYKQVWKQTQSTLCKYRTQLVGAEVYAVLECSSEHPESRGPVSMFCRENRELWLI